MLLHVRDELAVHADPVLGAQAQLAAFLDLLEDPGLDQRSPACHDGEEAAALHPALGLHKEARKFEGPQMHLQQCQKHDAGQVCISGPAYHGDRHCTPTQLVQWYSR